MGYKYGHIDGMSFPDIFRVLHLSDVIDNIELQKELRKSFEKKNKEAWEEYLEYEKEYEETYYKKEE